MVILQAFLFGQIVDGAFLKGQTLFQEMPHLFLLLGVILARAAIGGLHEISAKAIAVQVKSDLRRRLLSHIQALGPLYTRGERTGELATALVEGVEALDAYFSQFLPQIIVTALIPLTILFVILPLDGFSGVVMLVMAPMIPFFMMLVGKGAEAITRRQYRMLGHLSAQLLDALQGLTTLKLLGRSREYAGTVAQVSDRYRQATLRVLRLTFLSAFVLELCVTISTAVIAVQVGLRLLYAQMTFHVAFFVLLLAPEFYLPFRMLGLRFHAGASGLGVAERILAILDEKPLCPPPTPSSSAPVQAIVLEKVSFTYPGGSRPALHRVSMRLQRGEQVVLVGPSGAGKSTLVSLILGFIAPSEGRILTEYTDGTVVEGPPPRNQTAWVSQEPYLFRGTLEDNLRFARPEATTEELERAIQSACLEELVRSLPNGLKTWIGSGGFRLSAGEAQRLALARAFLKDAPILILDEPTSHLDPRTEAWLEKSTRHLLQNRIALIIAHRLHTIQNADHILVLDQGQVVEEGSHQDLMVRCGAYRRLLAAYRKGIHPPTQEAGPWRPPTVSIPEPPSLADLGEPVPPPGAPWLRRLLGFLRGYESWVALSVLLGVLTVGAGVSLMGTSAWLIAAAALHPPLGDLYLAIVGVRFFGIARAVFRYLERLVSHDVTFRVLARLRVWFYRALEPLAPARLMMHRAGDLLARIVGDIEVLENLYVRGLSPFLVAGATALGMGVFLWAFSPWLAVIVAGCFMAAGGLVPVWVRRLGHAPARDTVHHRAMLSALLVDGIQGLAELLVYQRTREHAGEIDRCDLVYRRAQLRLAAISALHTSLSILLANLALWGTTMSALPLLADGALPGVMLGVLGWTVLVSFEAAQPLPQAAQTWEGIRTAAGRLFEVVDSPPPVPDLPHPSSRPGEASIEVENLTFTYPGSVRPSLEEVSFHIPEGKMVAVVGPSGAGKSTLAHLLLRFWDYEVGEIRLGGISLKALSPGLVRSYFAMVSQNPFIFSATLRENLLLARPNATQEELEMAVRAARLEEVVARCPQGYDTYLGEHGWRLSAGERRRLAIARAVLQNAPILLLDEPTAHLDAVTEREVWEALLRLARGRTSIWITHRLAGMERMDEILVLDRGRLVERGTHRSLLAQNGLYRQMWELQP